MLTDAMDDRSEILNNARLATVAECPECESDACPCGECHGDGVTYARTGVDTDEEVPCSLCGSESDAGDEPDYLAEVA